MHAGAPARESIYPSDYPFQPKSVTIGGNRLAYLDVGQGERTLLLIHGNPVSGYIYDRLLRHLAGEYRCVVPDLLGFGLSEKPSAEAAYTLSKHIDMMAAFVEQLDLRDVVLVAHDWGGPIGFGAAVRQKARYSHLVILNTFTEATLKIRPVYWLPFHILLRLPRLADYLIKEHNLFQKMGVAIMDAEDQAVYFRANSSPQTRAGIAAFPRMIPTKRSHPNFSVLQGILSGLKTWDIPSLLIFSDKDSVFTAEQGERFAAQLRNGRFVLMPGAKHFLQYQCAAEVAVEIRNFLS